MLRWRIFLVVPWRWTTRFASSGAVSVGEGVVGTGGGVEAGDEVPEGILLVEETH